MRTYGALTVVSRDTGRLPIYLRRNLLAARGYPHYRGYRDRAHTAGDYYYYTIVRFSRARRASRSPDFPLPAR